MKFKDIYFKEEFSVGDEVIYKGKTYVIKNVGDDVVELIDTKKTRGDTIAVSKDDIEASQEGIPGIGGERAPKYRKRKTRKDAGTKREKEDSEQLSLF